MNKANISSAKRSPEPGVGRSLPSVPTSRGQADTSDARSTLEDKWKNAGIGNAFIFACVMRLNPGLLLELLQYALPDLEITGFERDPNEEVNIKTAIDAHGVRLNIVVHDKSGKVYDVEMQMKDEKNIPRRIRYYSSTIDQTCLSPGEDYNELKDAIVLFITSFDPFGLKLYRYTFRNYCVERKNWSLETARQGSS